MGLTGLPKFLQRDQIHVLKGGFLIWFLVLCLMLFYFWVLQFVEMMFLVLPQYLLPLLIMSERVVVTMLKMIRKQT